MDTVFNQRIFFLRETYSITLLIYFLLVLHKLIWIWSGYFTPSVEEGSSKPFKTICKNSQKCVSIKSAVRRREAGEAAKKNKKTPKQTTHVYSFRANYPLQRITRKKIFYNISSFILKTF